MAEIDRSLIGARAPGYVVAVEKGAIRKFADAIGDANPVYRDDAAARAQGYGGIIAPPTFPVSFLPGEEPPWTRDLDRRRILAGEQRFSYTRPIVAGDVLTCVVVFKDVIDKQGRSGRMEIILQEVVGTDADGNHVFTNTKSTVYREKQPETGG